MKFLPKFLVLSSTLIAYTAAEGCWEKTTQAATQDALFYRDIYDEVVETALEINLLKNIYGIRKLGVLIDTSISSRHDKDEADIIYFSQIFLMQAILSMVNGQDNYVVNFNEEFASGCDEVNCLSGCDILLRYTPLNVEMGPTSYCKGNIEAGCRLLHHYMTNLNCQESEKRMVVAFVNGDFYMNDKFKHRYDSSSSEEDACPNRSWGRSGSSEEDSFSPCLNYFDTRYIISVNSPTPDIIKRFPSKHGNHKHFHESEFLLSALENLFQYFLSSCCSTFQASNSTTPIHCSRTQGVYGEIIVDFPEHPNLTTSASRSSNFASFRKALKEKIPSLKSSKLERQNQGTSI